MNPLTPSQQTRKAKFYLSLGIVSFLLMGFFWALDTSIIFIFAGIGTFFGFLFFWNYPWQLSTKQNKNSSSSSGWTGQQTKQGWTYPPQPDKRTRTRINATTIKVLATLFGGVLFFVVVVALIVSDGDEQASDYFTQAESYRTLDNFDSSRYYYLKTIKSDPDHVDAWNNYGVLWMSAERYDSALYNFDQALNVNPDYEAARYNKALIYYYQKNYRKSLKEDFGLIEINPYYNDALQLAGDNYYAQQKYDSALMWYQNGYDNGHRNAWLCHVMGYLYDVKGETTTAISLYQEAVSYDPYKTDVFTRLGELLPGEDGEQYRMTAAQLKKDGY